MIVFQVVLRSLRKTFLGYKTGKRLGEDSSKGRRKKNFKYLTVPLRVFNLARGLSSGRNLSVHQAKGNFRVFLVTLKVVRF